MRFVLLLSILTMPAALMADTRIEIKPKVAERLFTERVFPFMRKNCAECHSETSVYPAGPAHSQADPRLAFNVFQRYMSWSGIENSSVMKMMNNKHFCVDYGSLCKEKDKLAEDYARLLEIYIFQVKKESVEAAPLATARVDGYASAPAEEASVSRKYVRGQKTKNKDEYIVVFEVNSLVRNRSTKFKVQIFASFVRYEGDYYQLASLYLSAASGIYRVSNLHLAINGHPLTAQSGLERTERILHFVKHTNPYGQKISEAHPILQLKEGDEISLGVGGIEELASFPAKLCGPSTIGMFARDSRANVGSLIDIIRPWPTLLFMDVTPLERCYATESRLDLRNLRRSILFDELTAEPRFSLLPQYLIEIEQWIALALQSESASK